MSRQAREISQTGMYHVIFKGNGRENIFIKPDDYTKLTEIIRRVKDKFRFELYAYCFMPGYVHLFLKEKRSGEISAIMSAILTAYATWFNIKYKRSGPLFCNRYKSEPIEDEMYYSGLIRYIHQKPLKEKAVKNIGKYQYSSYREYTENHSDIADIDFLLDKLESDRESAILQFAEFHKTDETEVYEISDSQKKSPGYIKRIIMSEIEGKDPSIIKKMDKETRNTLIKMLVNDKGISKSALERATGISRGTIVRICNERRRQTVPLFFD